MAGLSRQALGAGPWVPALYRYNVSDPAFEPRDEDSIEVEVQNLLNGMLQTKSKLRTSLTSTKGLTSFFKPKPAKGTIGEKVSKEARLRFLQLRHEMLMDNTELETLWTILREYVNVDEASEEETERIDYDRFCQISVRCTELFGEKCLPFFTPSIFLKFDRDKAGRISILPLFHYIMRKVSMQQTRIYLYYHDSLGDSHLRETDLEAYVAQMLPSLPPLANLEVNMHTQYKRLAVRKLMFFNDVRGRGSVRIEDLLVSAELAEFLELRQELTPDSEAALASNWFSLPNARRVYSMFLDLDEDMDGVLSRKDLAQFGGGGLTKFFIDMLFEEHVERWASKAPSDVKPSDAASKLLAKMKSAKSKRANHMDFPAFLEFVLAWENKKHTASLTYFFKVFDRKKRGYLDRQDINLFFRYVHERWVEGENYELQVDDVKDEIYDMIKPADPLRVTLKDLIDCKMGDTIVSMLSDITGFWQYDSRESLMQDPEE